MDKDKFDVVDPDMMVKGCKACSFSVAVESVKGFWNFCPCCGSTLVMDKIEEFHSNKDDSIETIHSDEYHGKYGEQDL